MLIAGACWESPWQKEKAAIAAGLKVFELVQHVRKLGGAPGALCRLGKQKAQPGRAGIMLGADWRVQ